MRKTLLLLAVAMVQTMASYAQVKLCPVFSDNMVMQQQTDKAPVWGESKPGKTITVTTSWDGKTYTTTADDQGQWKTAVKTPSAGGPYTVTISDGSKKKTVLQNVMIGEVWLCSGQSNMEMPIEGWGKVMNWQQEKAEANNYPNIRLLQAKRVVSSRPLDYLETNNGGWQVCNAENVAEFSSTAYFFGRDIHKYRNVPVGLIDSSWGGTIIETWMSTEAFANLPEQQKNLEYAQQAGGSREEMIAKYQEQHAVWLESVQKKDKGYNGDVATYAQTTFDDSAWKTVSMPQIVQGKEVANTVWWIRKTVDIPKKWSGKELTLHLGTIDDDDICFFNGVEIGRTAGFGVDRTYTIPGKLVKKGKATIAIRIYDGAAPTGINCDVDKFTITRKKDKNTVSLAGDWKYQVSMSKDEAGVAPQNRANNPNVHTYLYNAMINPIVPFAIKGAIWYQGCANVGQAYQYRELMPMMINDWRQKWGYDFPFYMVQLANFLQRNDKPVESDWAELREAQLMTRQHMEKVGMATTIDIGEANDIHPKNKQEVGRRLALAARATAYKEKIVFEGPLYRNYRIEDNAIRIMFARNTAKDMKASDGKALKGFQIAGADRKWHWAEAKIERGTVVVSSPEVAFPMAVRYAWSANPECNLVNGEGLPASPFRTDDWPGVTIDNKR